MDKNYFYLYVILIGFIISSMLLITFLDISGRTIIDREILDDLCKAEFGEGYSYHYSMEGKIICDNDQLNYEKSHNNEIFFKKNKK